VFVTSKESISFQGLQNSRKWPEHRHKLLFSCDQPFLMNLDFLKLLKLNLYASCFYELLKCSQIIALGNGSFEKGFCYL